MGLSQAGSALCHRQVPCPIQSSHPPEGEIFPPREGSQVTQPIINTSIGDITVIIQDNRLDLSSNPFLLLGNEALVVSYSVMTSTFIY